MVETPPKFLYFNNFLFSDDIEQKENIKIEATPESL